MRQREEQIEENGIDLLEMLAVLLDKAWAIIRSVYRQPELHSAIRNLWLHQSTRRRHRQYAY